MGIGGVAQDAPAQVLVIDRCRDTAYAACPGDKAHVLGGSAQVPHHTEWLIARRVGRDQRDGGGTTGEVAGVRADLGQRLERGPLANDDEMPPLEGLRRSRPPPAVA